MTLADHRGWRLFRVRACLLIIFRRKFNSAHTIRRAPWEQFHGAVHVLLACGQVIALLRKRPQL
jgi:hypothetical protein